MMYVKARRIIRAQSVKISIKGDCLGREGFRFVGDGSLDQPQLAQTNRPDFRGEPKRQEQRGHTSIMAGALTSAQEWLYSISLTQPERSSLRKFY
jgi:hypothetical protein